MTAQLNADTDTEIADLLWPTWDKFYPDADSRVVSVQERAIDAGLIEEEVRSWLLVVGHNVALTDRAGTSRYRHAADAVRALHGRGAAKAAFRTYEDVIADDGLWDAYWRTATERVLRSTSLPRRGALYEIAEVALVRLLRPYARGPKRVDAVARWRLGQMVLTSRILTQPDLVTKSGSHTRNRLSLSMDWVAATLGWSRDTAIRCYRGLAESGVITYQPGSRLTLAVYGYPSRNRSGEREYELTVKERVLLHPHRATVLALVDGQSDPVADIIRSAAHPAIAYSNVFDAVQLVVAFADSAGVYPETLGINKQAGDEARERTATLHDGREDETLLELLDRIADEPTYGSKRDKSEKQLAPRAAAEMARLWYDGNKVEATAKRQALRDAEKLAGLAKRYVQRLLSAHPSPTPPGQRRSRNDDDEERVELQRAWVDDLHNAVLGEPPRAAIAGLVKGKLQERLLTSGFKRSDLAEAVAAFVLEAPADADLDDYLDGDEDAGEDDVRPIRA